MTINPAKPPEGILSPSQPWDPADRIRPQTWERFRAKMTGDVTSDGGSFTTYIRLSGADADRVIENIKAYGLYPNLNTGGKYGGAENAEKYWEWIREEFLEKPFREKVDAKIEEAAIESRMKEIDAERKQAKPPKTKEEVVVIVEDKIEVLESILEDINPPRSEYQISDPWKDSYTTGAPQTPVKKTKKKGRPKGSKNKTTKKKKTPTGGGGDQPPSPPPKKSFATKMGGGLRNAGKSLGKSLLDKLEGGGPLGENQGPSVLSAGVWIGKKITTAFGDAKKQQQRAAEAEANGAELPPEMKDKGYFLKKALGYQFGGQVLDQTVGTFFENIPSKQSSKKAGFGDTFDYGNKDPEKKKKQAQQQSEIKDLASGFRNVTKSLGGINQAINQLTQTMTSLVDQTTRVADILEAIQNSIAGSIDVEINSDNDAAAADTASSGGDINIGDINLGGDGEEEGGLDILGILGGVDDVLDIANLRKKKKGLARQNRLYKLMKKISFSPSKARKKGMPKMSKIKTPGGFGKFGMLKNIMNVGRVALSEGTGPVAGPVNALVGEAGPELITRASPNKLAEGGGVSPNKLAEGGLAQGAGSNILATGLGASDNNLMKLAQPFANVMEMPFKVIGAQISGALASLVSAAGPFSGVLAKMFSPLLGGLATTFGLKKTAFAAELDSAAMTEKQGVKELSKFFSSFFKLFGIDIGGGSDDEEEDEDTPGGYVPIDWKKDPAFGEAVNKVAQHFNINAADLMGLMASESGLKPDEDNGSHVGLIQFSAASAIAAGTTQAALKKMSRAEQMPYVQKYLENAKLPKGASAGQLYTAVFLPAFVGKPDDFVVANKDGTEPSGYPESKSWYSSNKGLDMNNDGKLTIRELGERIQKKKKEFGIPMARGGVESTTNTFTNQIRGVFEMDGPDTGYRVPKDLTGGQPIIGHGLEWLIKTQNKFIILPGINKEYNVYRDPAKAFTRYEQIGSRGGVQVDGLVDVMGKIIYGDSSQDTEIAASYPVKKPPSWMDQLEKEYQRNIGRPVNPGSGRPGRGLGDTWEGPVKGASLPEGQITPIGIPRNTGSGTTGTTVVAMVQPMIQYITVPVSGPTQIEYVPANPFVAAKIGNEMVYLQGLS